GDVRFFNQDAELAITVEPIDGTKQYRDRDGNGYCVMLQLQMPDDVQYSLVYVPETGEHGTWTEVKNGQIFCGEDDLSRSAPSVLSEMEPWNSRRQEDSKRIYMIGFQDKDPDKAASLSEIGLEGVISANMPGSIYPLMATGEFAGSLIHSPNIYDFPASMQIARSLGGDALWVHNQEPVHFNDLWMDDRASMLRLPGVVACSPDRDMLTAMCEHAKDWNRTRYAD
ncbi:MAG: inositol monophosphatase family protein, partial [Planctomycetaceae bacterium]